MLHLIDEGDNYLKWVLFSDGATLHVRGWVNFHNV